ncbi:hypothetical protein HX017_07505 [Myroides marinus]|nr:hypothetical protein [Myroides marinus]MDM1350211.1 hypothetical protein [Myroides marinus]MDM1357418.1 hypothetical protein [Myroides marinus]MDM1364795.1 hypothetical protein [Myroides marinus]MDM1370001.1 hypothetical protein [Myroides marinus]MDM1370581.1 hypothetical protein [Myroides marinus]
MLRNILIVLGSMFVFSANAQVGVGLKEPSNSESIRPPHPGTPSRSPLIERESEVKEENKVNLQEYVEKLYQVGSAWYNDGALPTIASGEYLVVLIDKNGKMIEMPSYTRDLVNIKREEVKSIKYKSGPDMLTLYGINWGVLGMVFITLK